VRQAAEEHYERFWAELMCHYSSSVLHNISQLAQNRTRLYRMQLDMKRQEEQEGEEFNPLWNIPIRPDPFNAPHVGFIFVNSPSRRIRSSGALHPCPSSSLSDPFVIASYDLY
jgi:hypothetical protein